MEAQQLIPAGAIDVTSRSNSPTVPLGVQVDAEWDQLVQMWLHGRPQSTISVYEPEIGVFRRRVAGKRIAEVSLLDLQEWAMDLDAAGEKPRTIHRKLSTLKSMLTFAHRVGMIQFNPGAVLKMPHIANDLAERILSEKQIKQLFAAARTRRDEIMLETMYFTGIRATETAGLRWIDAKPRQNGSGQVSVLGKGDKTRSILLPAPIWQKLESIRPKDAAPEAPIFTCDDGHPLSRNGVTQIVRRAALRAGIPLNVSAHWMRHSHATHSMDHGAPLPLIQKTLGHSSLTTTQRYLHVNPEDSSGMFLQAPKRAVTKHRF